VIELPTVGDITLAVSLDEDCQGTPEA
jgi:hypothetical protein